MGDGQGGLGHKGRSGGALVIREGQVGPGHEGWSGGPWS